MGSLDEAAATGTNHDDVFSSVPSTTEVKEAMSQFESLMDGNAGSSPESSSKRNRLIEMKNDSPITRLSGYGRIQEAFHLLKTDSSVKEIVVSISSDKAVWDAVLSNSAVQSLRDSLLKGLVARISGEESDWAALILKWIFGRAVSAFGEMIAKFGMRFSETFQKSVSDNPSSEIIKSFKGTVESLFLLSVVVLIIVVVTRGREVTPIT